MIKRPSCPLNVRETSFHELLSSQDVPGLRILGLARGIEANYWKKPWHAERFLFKTLAIHRENPSPGTGNVEEIRDDRSNEKIQERRIILAGFEDSQSISWNGLIIKRTMPKISPLNKRVRRRALGDTRVLVNLSGTREIEGISCKTGKYFPNIFQKNAADQFCTCRWIQSRANVPVEIFRKIFILFRNLSFIGDRTEGCGKEAEMKSGKVG